MDWSYLVPLLVSIVFGIPGYLALRKPSDTSLVFYEEDNINLYSKVINQIDSLVITLDGDKIDKQLFLIRGVIVCSGRRDIVKSNIIKTLNFKLPDGGKWRKVESIGMTPDLNVDLRIKDDELLIDFDLMKKGDYLYIEALGESPSQSYIIDHRIANVSAVKKIGIEPVYYRPLLLLFGFLAVAMWYLYSLGFFSVHAMDLESTYYSKGRAFEQFKDASGKIKKEKYFAVYYDSLGTVVKKDTVDSFNYSEAPSISIAEANMDSVLRSNTLFSFLFRDKIGPVSVYKEITVEYLVRKGSSFYMRLVLLLFFCLVLVFVLFSTLRSFRQSRILDKIIYPKGSRTSFFQALESLFFE